MKTGLTTKVRKHIENMQAGTFLTKKEIYSLGPRASVYTILGRLVEEGIIKRSSHGMYFKPKKFKYSPEQVMGLKEVAQQIAKIKKIKLVPHGAELARRFGLTTQMQVVPMYMTNGPSHTIKVGKFKLKIKRVSPRKLGPEEGKVGEAIALMWHLGKEQMKSKHLQKIQANLNTEEFESLLSYLYTMPIWMQNALKQEGWVQDSV